MHTGNEFAENLIVGTTKSGFDYTIDKRCLTDWKFVDLSTRAMDKRLSDFERLSVTREMLDFVLGVEQCEALENHIRANNDGFAPIDVYMGEVEEIISRNDEEEENEADDVRKN